ncbi:hypothetical protein ASD02_29955 [Ensifer sp. Root1252]|jgi:hypothetical protein|nr:hypothetical protein ASD00_21135 [Ensifer sp. Root31]KQW56073.1 hypothetical protein ASD02_29955 [Ensifer sp. Root1252]KQW83347.1 hypothetical protein ASD03_21925 [Ensifer sp. Root127]KQY70077.1 hypothetical protein ASD52_30935 [Ensifer sp. Root142]KRC77551.1 hypothetical protein ASE32_29720 [Ensifer sp. Root231]KRC96380.1 hypothetical protein ASE47_32650 [Ensifer sp. Root258]OMQ44050.1 hypothetical protein BKP54_14995 [Ensifer sp. 1H6]
MVALLTFPHGHALLRFGKPCIGFVMTKASAYRIATISAAHDDNRAPLHAFASLLLLGLTRGCRVR